MTNNYTYSLLANSTSIQRSDGASIPADPRNSDYMQYQAWVSAGNTPTPVPLPTLAQVQAAQIASVNAAAQAALQKVIAGYPDLEVATWPQQYAEALAYSASNTAPTPMLSAIATASGQTVAALATGVISKATAYQAASGAAVGRRITLTAQIQAATTVAAVQAINY